MAHAARDTEVLRVTGPYPACVAATVAGILLLTLILRKKPWRVARRLLGLAVCLGLLYAPVFLFVRLPFDDWFRTVVGVGATYQLASLFYAPLTEEISKLWPLTVPDFKHLSQAYPASCALIVGIGFGMGELWLIGALVAQHADLGAHQWYSYMPFLGERIMVFFLHAGMTGVALHLRARRYRLPAIFVMVASIHLLINLPIYLTGPSVVGLSELVRGLALTSWLAFCLIVAARVLAGLAFPGPGRIATRMLGMRLCPHCGKDHEPPLLWAINTLQARIERCPHCGKACKYPKSGSVFAQ